MSRNKSHEAQRRFTLKCVLAIASQVRIVCKLKGLAVTLPSHPVAAPLKVLQSHPSGLQETSLGPARRAGFFALEPQLAL
jgi:hypothetical protein